MPRKKTDSPEKRKTRGDTKKDEQAKKKPIKKPTRTDKGKGKGKAEESPKKTRAKPTKIATKPTTPATKHKNNTPKKMTTRIEHAIKANPDPKGPTRTTLKNWIKGEFIVNEEMFEKEFDETIK
ncbi:hypothetical protein BGZ81_003237, partial [Podila clonocystis]